MAKIYFWLKKVRMNKARKQTIPDNLLKQWKKLKRMGDAEKLAIVLGVSKPTINNAIIYGAVNKVEYVEKINKFFADRLLKEQADAVGLAELQK